jgi:exopolysaccharide/PEP-CTERM locus tyrosine autokinase
MSFFEKALKKIKDEAAEQRPDATFDSAFSGPKEELDPAGLPNERLTGKIVDLSPGSAHMTEFLTDPRLERLISDQYREIKRPLVAVGLGRGVPRLANGSVVMVTSSFANEGKTFTSMNLALSIARERDTTALLVDADLAKQHITRSLGLVGEKGLLDALQDESVDPESLLVATTVRGLRVLPAGSYGAQHGAELMNSLRMEQIVRQLANRYSNRMVIFDSAPLLLTSESRSLAQMVAQVLFVVRAGATPQAAVFDALRRIGKERLGGIVLNQTEEPSPGGYYYKDKGYAAYAAMIGQHEEHRLPPTRGNP